MAISYLNAPLLFRVRKVLRYVHLYGLSRTLVKVRGQYHLADEHGFSSTTWSNPACSAGREDERFVAIIGCGGFAYSCIAYYLRRRAPRFLVATYDTNGARARSMCRAYGGRYATGDVRRLIDDPEVRLVYIASNHASHAEYAIACIEAGKHVHIEKPHVVSSDQLERLMSAQRAHPDVRVFLGFNRPKSEHFRRVKEALDSQTGPTMINWFIAGHEIADDHWYFSPSEGGRVLGNLCHWTDLTLELVGHEKAFPCEVIPAGHAGAKSDFCVGIRFRDGSVAGITFSAKGHTFEGVREILNAHRGDALINMTDFETTSVEIVERRRRYRTWHRDHGHRRNVLNSFESVLRNDWSGAVRPERIEGTARLFLGVKDAIDRNEPLRVTLD